MSNTEEKIMLYLCNNPGSSKQEVYKNIAVKLTEFIFWWGMLINDGMIRGDIDNDKWYIMAP